MRQMDRTEMHSLVQERIDLIQKVLAAKGVEYGEGEDGLHNFNETTRILPWLFLNTADSMLAMASKHLVSVLDLLTAYHKDNKLPNMATESFIREKFGDLINYLIMMEAYFVHQQRDDLPF